MSAKHADRKIAVSVLSKAENVIVLGSHGELWCRIARAIAGKAWSNDVHLGDRTVRAHRLTDSHAKTYRILLSVSGSPLRGLVSWNPIALRGDGPLMVRADVPEQDRLSRPDRELIVAAFRGIFSAEGWL